MVPDLTADITKKRSDGDLFHIVSNGIRTMPGYSKKIDATDRWAIVAYLRALQKMTSTSPSELPPSILKRLQSKEKDND